jgi:DNA transformation protein and related proteins
MSGAQKLLNVGPKSAAWLRQVGVRTQADLEALGSVAAFMKVKRAGFRPSLNLLYALEGALLGCHWQQLPDERRGELLIAVDAAEAALPPPRGRPAAAAVIETAGPGADADAAAEAPTFGFDDPAADGGGSDDD